MRACEACSKPDRPVLDFETLCDPKLCDPRKVDERPETHHEDCPKVIHEVRRLYKPAVLVNTPKHPEGELERRFREEGWKVLKDGRDVFRWRMLCRDCIEKEAEREMVRRDYVKACKAARGVDERTYGQFMMEQSG